MNNILDKILICSSNFDLVTKNEIEQTVQTLGGSYFDDLKKTTKVVISCKINTEKCLVNKIIIKFRRQINMISQ